MTNPFAGQQAPQQPAAPSGPAAQAGPPQFHGPNKGGGTAITQDDWRSFVGHLVLFEVQEIQRGIKTKNGPADAVIADVHVIDHPAEPKVFERASVFPPALVTATKEVRDENGHLVVSAGERRYMVLGRLAEYTTKEGRQTFQLVDHAPEDAKTATDYLQWRQQQQLGQPQSTQAQPAATPAPAQQGQDQPPW